MKLRLILIAGVCVCAIAASLQAQEAAEAKTAPTTRPAVPAGKPTALASVGKAQIMSNQVDATLAALPPGIPEEQLSSLRQDVLSRLIIGELIHAYVEAKNVPCDEKPLKELEGKLEAAAKEEKLSPAEFMAKVGVTKEKLRDKVRVDKLVEQTTGEKQVADFMKGNPSFFNGTKVQASHILIACKPTAPTAEQKAAVAKIEKIAGEIKASKITFEKAAEQHSVCPSGKAKGGDLGEFTFDSMVPPFAMAAFGMKVGETSGVVRTQFGFHLIKVTGRTEGKEQPGTTAQDLARAALMSGVENAMFDQALTTCPIVINEQ